ncbi:MAG: ion transporter, partial [Chloroflexia bacterium]
MKDAVSKKSIEDTVLVKERHEILEQVESWLELPMLALGLGWLILFVVEVVWGLSRFLQTVSTAIWIIFIIDFVVRFTLAPFKLNYLKKNWLTALSLAAPALRLLKIARLAQILRVTRVARGMTLLRIVASLNRGMRALSATMRRRGFGYVVLLTIIVGLVGAAGMLAFEGNNVSSVTATAVTSGAAAAQGFQGYSGALWWTAMALTTMGSDYSPMTPEGRILAFIIALYAFAAFGYVTATLATFFIGRDSQSQKDEIS